MRNLRESDFRDMADHAPVMLWMTDTEGLCTYLNHTWCSFTGRSQESGLGFGWLASLHPEDAEIVHALIFEAKEKHAPYRTEYRLQRRDGEYRWAMDAACPRFGADGQYLGHIGTIVDITERKESEEERELLLQQAEEAVRARDEFLSIASHELKTPIAALTFQSAKLAKLVQKHQPASSPDQVAQTFTAMERQLARLTSLVEDLLDISRVASRGLQVHPEMVDLVALVQDVLHASRPMFERARCELSLDAPAQVACWADPLRLRQVMDNLLENAAKYGPGAPVKVQLACNAESASIVVQDNGIGIGVQDQQRIFGRFERAVPSRHYGGLGLGLWITRQILSAMGGAIHVDSRVGHGSTFTVTLPRGKPS